MTTALHDLITRTPGLPCRTEPAAWYSPDPTERHYAAQQCHGCPLLLDCMRYALAADEKFGVWGGVDMEARAIGCGTERGFQIHKRRKEQVCPSCQAAHDEAVEADRRRRLGAEHALGGSLNGYHLHRKLGESACVPCRRALARHSAERRERERVDAERARAEWDARKAADRLRGAQAGVQPLALAG